MLSCLPFLEEVIAAAKAAGWTHSRRRLSGGFRDTLRKAGKPTLILQPISDQSWYGHTIAKHYARHLEIEIEPLPAAVLEAAGREEGE